MPSIQTQRSACSVPQLWPIIPGQPVTRSARLDLDRALEGRVGERGDELGPRQWRLVEPVGGQVATGPARRRSAATSWRRAPLHRPSPPPPPARSRRRRRGSRRRPGATTVAGTVTLVARGARAARSKSVNQIDPVGSCRRPLVDGMADPDAEAAARPARLHVEALVMACLPRRPLRSEPVRPRREPNRPPGSLAGRPVRLTSCRERPRRDSSSSPCACSRSLRRRRPPLPRAAEPLARLDLRRRRTLRLQHPGARTRRSSSGCRSASPTWR